MTSMKIRRPLHLGKGSNTVSYALIGALSQELKGGLVEARDSLLRCVFSLSTLVKYWFLTFALAYYWTVSPLLFR